ncbi:MAG: FHA domain-containing protein [Planctomycetes bacterium]|nr:FHA domain-containing protein [Planctomycetota bacterium]
MYDPRLNSVHLCRPRRKQYGAARAEMLDAMGSTTHEVERRVLGCRNAPLDVPVPYSLRSVRTGRLYPLRVGINTIGRAPTNDIVLGHHAISRRHCVVLVHATGGCEVHDTASRNGTFVNRQKVSRIALHAGDLLQLCDDVFVVLGGGANDGTIVLGDGGGEEPGDLRDTGADWHFE